MHKINIYKYFIMKKTIIFLFFLIICSFEIKADFTPIIIQNGGGAHDHNEIYLPADMPEAVYYDSDEMEIVIEADGLFTSYYNVLIIRNSTNQTMISTQISGYGDSIDVSSLPSDNYTLVLTTESNNVFEGQFAIQ